MCILWSKAKRGETFTQYCPESDLINTHMESISDDHQQLHHDSRVCLTCYKYYHSIIIQVWHIQGTDSQSCPEGSTLDGVFSNIASCVHTLSEHDLSVNDYLELMRCLTAKKVGEYFQRPGIT